MNPLPPIVITLDRPREIAWTQRAEVRLSSLPRVKRGGGLYQLCALVWSALVEKNHPFDDPEDLGEFMTTSEAVREIGAAIVKARERANDDSAKNANGSMPKPSPSSSLESAPSNSGDSPQPNSKPTTGHGERK